MAESRGLIDPRNFRLPLGELTAVGIKFDKGVSFEDWQAAGAFLERAEGSVQWWIGDWLLYGEGRAEWGEKYEQAISIFNRDYQTLANYKSVSKAIEFSSRKENLSWTHHLAVAWEPPKTRDKLLREAEPESADKQPRLSVAELRRKVRQNRIAADTPPLPKKKFNLIYADPPWEYDFSLTDNRKIENQYPTMPIDDICQLGVSAIAADDCVLFLWATSPKLTEAMRVISEWGFTYKTCMVWRKDKIGMGYYARQQHELLLIATTGNPPPPPESSRPASVVEGERMEHSRKPEKFYALIEQMYPKFKKVELFCREPRKGWHAWGNEVPSDAA